MVDVTPLTYLLSCSPFGPWVCPDSGHNFEPMLDKNVSIGSLLGSSQAMDRIRGFARKAARVNAPVLILGETGTGKSLLGKIIHGEGPRASKPYLAINCAGIPDSLFESEFFGHQRGAFTGARDGRRGILEQAQSGSLFLDEIGELSVPQQAKLLTSLEEGEVRRLGGEGVIRVDVRVLAATSRDLSSEMKEGGFRRDLFHRLAVLTCHIPPLRDRREDIPVLALRLLRAHGIRHGCPVSALSSEAIRYLESELWPGNVRELSHRLEAGLILSEGKPLGPDLLQMACAVSGGEVKPQVGEAEVEERSPEWVPVARGLRRYSFSGTKDEEKESIRLALRRARGNKSQAARAMGMARNTLRMKLKLHGLE